MQLARLVWLAQIEGYSSRNAFRFGIPGGVSVVASSMTPLPRLYSASFNIFILFFFPLAVLEQLKRQMRKGGGRENV